MMRISLDSPALIAVRNWLAGSVTRQPHRPGRKASRTLFLTEQLEPRMMLDAGMRALLPDLVAASDTRASDSDNLTRDRSPALTGSVQGGASQVRLVVDGQRVAVLPVVNGTAGAPLSRMVAAAVSTTLVAGTPRVGNPTRVGSPTVLAASAVLPTLVAGTPRVGSPAASDGRVTGAAVFVDSGGGTVNHVGPGVSAGGGSVSVDGAGGFVYTPTAAQRRAATPATTDTFTVTASNGRHSASQTITVRVDPGRLVAAGATVGTPNVATGVVSGSSGLADNVGRTVTFTVSGVPTFRTANGTSAALAARDPAGGLSSTGVSAGGGAVSVDASGAFLYTPTQAQRRAAVAGSTDTFWVTANNTQGLRTQQITVLIDPGTPVAGSTTPGSPDSGTGAVTGTAAFTDTAGRTLTYSTTGSSAGGGTVIVDPSTGAFTYTPTLAQRQAATGSSTDTFTVTASNGVRSTAQTVTVAVDPGTPVAGSTTPGTPDTGTGAVTGTAAFTDTAGRTLTYSTTGSSAGGGTVIVDPATGAFTYTPALAQRQAATGSTTDTFTVTASNGVRSATQTVTVVVDPGTPVAGTPTVNSATVGSKTYNSTYLAATPSTTTVFTNTSLHEVVGISGNLGGAWVAAGAATPYHYTSNGTTAVVQLQIADSTFVKMVKVRLSQSGSNLVATVMYARYAAVAYLGSNFDTLGAAATSAPIATSGSATGYGVSSLTITTKVVTGSAAFTDSAGRTLTYSASATSTGGGKVTINSTTGAFTYVPTTAQRQSAGTTPTDTFTVTADNGVRTVTQTITVPVS